MNVLYVCDDKYSYFAGISIISLLDSQRKSELISIFLVNDGISNENIQKLKHICNRDNVVLEFIDFSAIGKLIQTDIKSERWNKNVFARLLCGEIFCNRDIDKIIYLDCDTLVMSSLDDLWATDLKGNLVAAVNESMGVLHKRAIGLNDGLPYVNSGVLLIDVNNWKKYSIDKKILDYISKHGKLEYPDEAALNNVLQNRILLLKPKYNATSLTFYFTVENLKKYRKSRINNSKTEWNEAVNSPVVVHFTSTFLDERPWEEGCKHKYVNVWREKKNNSPWSQIPYKSISVNCKKMLIRKTVELLPLGWGYSVAGFLHAYVKPIRYIILGQIIRY